MSRMTVGVPTDSEVCVCTECKHSQRGQDKDIGSAWLCTAMQSVDIVTGKRVHIRCDIVRNGAPHCPNFLAVTQ